MSEQETTKKEMGPKRIKFFIDKEPFELFTLGALFALYEGVEKVLHPEPLTSPGVAIGLLLVAVGLESWSFRTALGEARAHGGGARGLLGFVRRSKNPELPVVLLEDIGALAGLVVALAASVLAWKVDPVWDGYGTLVIGGLLAVIATFLAVEMKSLLIGEAASPEDLAAIRRAVEHCPSTSRLIHLRTEHLGPEQILVAMKVAFAAGLDVPALAAAIDDVEAAVRAVVPEVTLVYVEPDLDRGATP